MKGNPRRGRREEKRRKVKKSKGKLKSRQISSKLNKSV
jgi:hypothetical protein